MSRMDLTRAKFLDTHNLSNFTLDWISIARSREKKPIKITYFGVFTYVIGEN